MARPDGGGVQARQPVWVPLDARGVLAVTGADARSFLQGMISNDINKVDGGHAIYAGLLTPQGKFLHDFFVVEHDGGFLLDCERDRLDDLVRRLTLYRLRAKVAFADCSETLAVLAVLGEDAAGLLGLAPALGRAGPFGGGVAFVDPRLTGLGARAILPRDGAAAALETIGCTPGTPADYDRRRLALAVPDGSRDIQVDKAFLLESNFEELHGVDFTKGCYVGQENTSRQKYRGSVRKRLMRVDIDGPLPAPGTPVLLGDREVGTMRSGLDGIGLALLRLEPVEEAIRARLPLVAGEARLNPVKPDWAE